MQRLKKIMLGFLSICMVLSGIPLSPAAIVLAEDKTETGTEWEKVSGILDTYPGIYTKDTKLGDSWDTGYSPDGPLMGNGTVYAFMAGDQKTQNLYISHSNMWQDRASKDGQEYTTFGGITIGQSNNQNTDIMQEFGYEQDMKNAEITAQSEQGFTTKSWLSAKENIIVTEITNITESELPMEVSAWTANANTTAAVDSDTMIATKTGVSEPKDRDSGTGKWEGWNVNISMASTIIDDIKKTTQNLDDKKNTTAFTLEPGQTVTMVSAVEGGKEDGMENTLEQTKEKALAKLAERTNSDALAASKQAHRDYWKEYWLKSYVDIEDAKVERMYYGMLYQLGCSSSVSSENNGEVAAGLFPWTAVDHPAWQGDYTTNTDFQRQLHPLVQANRTSGMQNYLNVIQQYWPEAERRARSAEHLNWIVEGIPGAKTFTAGMEGAALFPTHIGPWGASTEQYNSSDDYFNSPTNGTSVLMPLVKMWEYTQDEAFLEKLYPMMKSVSIFWENYVTLEDGKYVVYGATHEGVPGRNPILDVDGCKYMLENTIKAAVQLGVDTDKVEIWQNILDHMSDVPTMQYQGKTTICDVEGRTEGDTGMTFAENPVTIQSVYYFDSIGMSASEEEKEKYINYLNVKNGMGNHRRLISATRLGYDINEIIEQLKQGAIDPSPSEWEGLRGNNTIGDIGRACRIAIVQESLLQSNEGFINIFANWYDNQEASFRRMGAEGAFLVDADQNTFGQVTYAKIHSEKGKTCSVLNPWAGKEMEIYQNESLVPAETSESPLGTVYTFSTEADGDYELKLKGELEGFLRLDTTEAEIKVGNTKKLTAITSMEEPSVSWSSSDPEVAAVGMDGTVIGLSEGTATITASIKETELTAECAVSVIENMGENVALQGTATANSQHENYDAQRAINGEWNPSYEGWVSAGESWEDAPNRWLAIDLGEERTITRWVLKHGGHKKQNTEDPVGDPNDDSNWGDYHLQVSENGESDWKTVDSKRNNVNNTTDQTLKEPVTGRYFRIYMEFPQFQPSAGWEWTNGFARLNQIELYTPSTEGTVSIAEVETFKDITVVKGEQFEDIPLPQQAKVKLNNGMEIMVQVIWEKGEFNSAAAGTYTLNGTLNLPGAITNPDGLVSAIQVHINESDKIDLTSLHMAIAMAETMETEQNKNQTYTEESWAAVAEALEAARALLERGGITQEEADTAFLNLTTVCSLTENKAPKVGLKVAIDGTLSILTEEEELAKYEEASVEAVRAALSAAQAVYDADGASQEEINTSTNNLLSAVTSLIVKKPDKRLTVLIQKAEELLEKEEQYTTASIENLKNALEAARIVADNVQASAEEINGAYIGLVQAMTTMVRKANKEELKNAMDQANRILEESHKYLESSIAGLQSVADAAQLVYDNEEADSGAVGEALKTLIQEILKARLMGDVDQNGTVDTQDAAMLLRNDAELETLTKEQELAADVNQDGMPDSSDAVVILEYAAEMITDLQGEKR